MKTLTISLTVAAGGAVLWTAMALQGAGTVRPGLRLVSAQGFGQTGLFPFTAPDVASDNLFCYVQDSVTGSLPNPMVPAASSNNAPIVWLRKA